MLSNDLDQTGQTKGLNPNLPITAYSRPSDFPIFRFALSILPLLLIYPLPARLMANPNQKPPVPPSISMGTIPADLIYLIAQYLEPVEVDRLARLNSAQDGIFADPRFQSGRLAQRRSGDAVEVSVEGKTFWLKPLRHRALWEKLDTIYRFNSGAMQWGLANRLTPKKWLIEAALSSGDYPPQAALISRIIRFKLNQRIPNLQARYRSHREKKLLALRTLLYLRGFASVVREYVRDALAQTDSRLSIKTQLAQDYHHQTRYILECHDITRVTIRPFDCNRRIYAASDWADIREPKLDFTVVQRSTDPKSRLCQQVRQDAAETLATIQAARREPGQIALTQDEQTQLAVRVCQFSMTMRFLGVFDEMLQLYFTTKFLPPASALPFLEQTSRWTEYKRENFALCMDSLTPDSILAPWFECLDELIADVEEVKGSYEGIG